MNAIVWCYDKEEAVILRVLLQQAGFVMRVYKELDTFRKVRSEITADLFLLAPPRKYATLIDLVKECRQRSNAVIILITEHLPEEDQIELLEAGSDYICPRPYGPRLLLTQIRIFMRRFIGTPIFSLPTLTLGDVVLDPASYKVHIREDQVAQLTQLEFRLLYTLMTYRGQVVPAETLVEHIWGYSGDGNRELVRGLVKRLRSKISQDKEDIQYIKTVAGVGYYFENSGLENPSE
ncbi:MAG: response regulator transcription factor [Anaerolineales bacterium]|nr:response regulator transcription factor [Anaerolineales bacterium]